MDRDNGRKRAETVKGLRELADLLEVFENMPIPFYPIRAGLFLSTAEEARAARKGIYGWVKHNDKSSSYMSYTLEFGEDPFDAPVKLVIEVSKATECARVQVDTRHVEAQFIEAHDEPVYEWKCDGDTEDAQAST